jgi:putative transposase
MNIRPEINVGEHYNLDGAPFQVLDIRKDAVKLRSLRASSDVRFRKYSELLSCQAIGRLIKIQEAPLKNAQNAIIAALSNEAVGKLDRKLAWLRRLDQDCGGSLPSGDAYVEWVERASVELNDPSPPCRAALGRWRQRYANAGTNPLALLDKRRQIRGHPLDRRSDEVRDIIVLHIKRGLYKQPPDSKTAVIFAITEYLKDLNLSRPDLDQFEVPSTSTLYRILCDEDAYRLDIAQYGRKEAGKYHYFGRALYRPRRLFELVEADTHEMHIMVVDAWGEVIGRPWLTVFIEIRTRCVIGWDISFNAPSIDTTIRAFVRSIDSSNPLAGLAMRYRTDNGAENIAADFRESLGRMGTQITYTPPGTPNQKPFVEAFFKTWTVQMSDHIKGTTYSNVRARGNYDSEAHATVTMQKLQVAFKKWLDNVYHRSPHSGIGGISPLAAWSQDIDNELPPRRYATKDIRGMFWRKKVVKPNGGKVRHNFLFWTGPAVDELINRYPRSKKLHLFYDRGDLGQAWLVHPKYPDDPIELDPVNPEYQIGLTMHMHNEIRKRLTQQGRKFTHTVGRQAMAEILVELHNERTKKERQRLHKAVENGYYMTESAVHSALPNEITMPTLIDYHESTPTLYSIVSKYDEKHS